MQAEPSGTMVGTMDTMPLMQAAPMGSCWIWVMLKPVQLVPSGMASSWRRRPEPPPGGGGAVTLPQVVVDTFTTVATTCWAATPK